MRRPLSVHVFLVCQHEQQLQYLILQRKPRPELDLPAFHQGVSGALEHGEQFADAALREVREETGYALDEVWPTGYAHAFAIKPQWRAHYGPGPQQVEEHVFVADVTGRGNPVLSDEHGAWQWLTLQQALPLLDYGHVRECLLQADQFLSAQRVPTA